MTYRIYRKWPVYAIAASFWLCLGSRSAPVRDDYVYIEDIDRHFILEIGGKTHYGDLDRSGNFMPTEINVIEPAFIGGLPRLILNAPRPKKGSKPEEGIQCYEFRSGRLVPGKMMEDGNFVPELDSKVIRFEDYKYDPNGQRIYNLPGYFLRRDKLDERRKWLAERLAEPAVKNLGEFERIRYTTEKAKLDAAVEKRK